MVKTIDAADAIGDGRREGRAVGAQRWDQHEVERHDHDHRVTVTIETVPALFLAMSPAPYTRRVLCPSIATIITCSGPGPHASDASFPNQTAESSTMHEAPHPLVSFITTDRWAGSYPRKARWLLTGFAELGLSYDAVLLEGPRGIEHHPGGRVVHLGVTRARYMIPRLVGYLREARPVLALSAPPTITIPALVAGRLSGIDVIPWEPSFKSWETTTAPAHPRSYMALRQFTYRGAPAIAGVSSDVVEVLADELRPRCPPTTQ